MSAEFAVELWDITRLIPYENNAKKHPEAQVKKLAGSIKRLGWTQPIVVDRDGVIIIGHGRRLAALSLGIKKVPVLCRKDLTKAEADAMRIADNQVTSTEYDVSIMQAEISKLYQGGFEVDVLGFDDKELEFLTADLGEINEDIFVDDISEAVETQKAENKKAAEAVDESAAPVADAIGFKRLTVAQSRIVRGFMAKIEAKTGQKGAEALCTYIQGYAVY
jgi:ParB-like chromosome segregation protein Spo0J